MIRVVVAPDKLKECLDAPDVAAALAAGLRAGLPDAEVVTVPMADGGQGTARVLACATGGSLASADVAGPLGGAVRAGFALLGDGATAVVESAEAAGLHLVASRERDPLRASTFGVGEALRAALGAGRRRIVVALGGTATCDGGAGLAQALGVRLLDADGRDLPRGGAALVRLARIDASGLAAELRRDSGVAGGVAAVEVVAACDVDNPLLGPDGAAATYGPQKGATPGDVAALEAGLGRLAAVAARDLGRDVRALPGAGAGGGLGAGLAALLGAALRPGFDLVADAVGLDAHLAAAHVCVTAEGALDEQTSRGKVPCGVAARARARGVEVVALAGSVREGAYALHERGVGAILSIVPGPMSLQEATERAPALLRRAGEEVGRLLALGRRLAPMPGT